MTSAVEIEWQLEGASLAAVRRWLATRRADTLRPGPAVRVVQHDTYWDTADWRLYRAGVALRTRRTPGRLVATLKEIAPARRGPSRRREHTTTLPATARPGATALCRLPGAVGERVRRLAGPGPLRRLFVVVTRRTVVTLRTDDGPLAELVLDRTTIARDGRVRCALERVEVELVDDAPPHAERLVAGWVRSLRRGTGLRAAARSKFERGLAACRLRPPRRR